SSLVLYHIRFSSQRNGHPPDLHSFPTRRSSDLSSYETLKQQYKWELINVLFKTIAGALRTRLALATGEKQRQVIEALAQQLDAADRKSTRLNSSHQIISYAVFCLKKKTTRTKTV